VLADEPTGNLDRRTARLVGELLLRLHQEEQTILIVVTHSLELARLLPVQRELVDGLLQPLERTAP
jgi:lipoprotein-releasing system ATP-binding protein